MLQDKLQALKEEVQKFNEENDNKEVGSLFSSIINVMEEMNEKFSVSKLDETVGRINEYSASRIKKIENNDTFVEFDSIFHLFTMQIIPVEAFENKHLEKQYNLNEIDLNNHSTIFRPICANGWNPFKNAEGLITYNNYSYTQIYRNGVVEVVDAATAGASSIAAQPFEERIVKYIEDMLGFLNKIGVKGELLVKINLLNVENLKLATDGWNRSKEITEECLSLPDALLTIGEEVEPKLRGTFEAFRSKFAIVGV
ncbi:hypothetical protein ACU3L3_07070 [Priestia endophytica]